jgi:hypothetical protein
MNTIRLMMKSLFRSGMVGLLLLASACSGVALASAPTTSVTAIPPLTVDYQGALPGISQLGLGMFKLEGTPQAVDHAEAVNLLPLWKGLRALSGNQTTAPEELQALMRQIQETMTPDQVQTIAAMQLTSQDIATVLQANGFQMAGGAGSGRFGNLTPEQMATRQAARQSGQNSGRSGQGGGSSGRQGGGFPGDGGGGGGFGGGGFGGAQTTQTPFPYANRGGNTINLVLLQAVIQFLQGK